MNGSSTRMIRLPCFGITIRLRRGKDGDAAGMGAIASDLHVPGGKAANRQFNAAIDCLESLILAHACAGVDVQSPAYIEGIETGSRCHHQPFYVRTHYAPLSWS